MDRRIASYTNRHFFRFPYEGCFNLILLDGHWLRTHRASVHRPLDGNILLISQLVVAFERVAKGGTLICKLSRPEFTLTATVLYALDQISENLTLVKPVTSHATRGTFYAIAQCIASMRERETARANYARTLRAVWWELCFAGEAPLVRP